MSALSQCQAPASTELRPQLSCLQDVASDDSYVNPSAPDAKWAGYNSGSERVLVCLGPGLRLAAKGREVALEPLSLYSLPLHGRW